MESWSVGFEGDPDVERHAGVRSDEQSPSPRREPLRLREVSDYIWPWCFIGLVRVERLCREFDVEVDAWAYNLRPGLPPEGLPREEAYRGRRYPQGYFQRLQATAREAGIEMIKRPVVANTFKAHEATEFAKEQGRLMPFHRAVFSAYWEKGENIGREDVLCRVAAECGMDGDQLRSALAGGRYRRRVEEQMDWARTAGVSGVPTYVFFAGGESASGGNRMFALVGAQEYDVFADVARRIEGGALT